MNNEMPNESDFMHVYTVKQVGEMLDIPPGTIRQWEKSLEGVLVIPRDEKSARYYTDFEMDSLRRVKALRDKGVSFEVIREILSNSESPSDVKAISTLPTMSQSEAIKALVDMQQMVQHLSEHIDEIVEQRVQAALNERFSLLEENQEQRDKRLEERLTERDRILMETLRNLQETASTAAKQQERRKGLFGWLRRD